MEKILDKTFLIIEDDCEMVSLIKKIITNQGGELFWAKNVNEGIKLAKDKKPHLIYLDLNLSGESGLNFLRQKSELREIDQIPIVVVTAYNKPRLIQKCHYFNISGFIYKPINSYKFIQKTNSVLESANRLFYNFQNPLSINSRFRGELKKISEMEIQFNSNVKLHENERITLEGNILNKIDICTKKSIVVSDSISNQEVGYDTCSSIHGLSEKALIEIRKLR